MSGTAPCCPVPHTAPCRRQKEGQGSRGGEEQGQEGQEFPAWQAPAASSGPALPGRRRAAARWRCAPVEAVADGAAAAHELEEQQQGLRGDAQGAGVHQAEQRVCRRRGRGEEGAVREQTGAEGGKGNDNRQADGREQYFVACTHKDCSLPSRPASTARRPRPACPPTCPPPAHPPACASISGSTSSAGT